MRRVVTLLSAGAGLLLSGCAVSQAHLGDRFGEAVKQNIAAQIADPDARYKGDVDPGADGARVAGAQSRYRSGTVIKPADTGASDISAKASGPSS